MSSYQGFSRPKSVFQNVREEAGAYIAEFVGTFMLVLTVVLSVGTGANIWNVTAIAACLMVMIYATGPISGGNLNPCVSLCLALLGKLHCLKAVGYIIVQLIAGFLAGLVGRAMLKEMPYVGPAAGWNVFAALFMELLYTCMLCFVVANVAASFRNNPETDKNHFFALAIGFVVVAGGYTIGDISGAYLNPAIALGVDLAGWSNGVKWGFLYTLFQIAGAILAACLFFVIRREDYTGEDLEDYEPNICTKMLSEFLGTFILVFTVCVGIFMGHSWTAWAAAAALMCMIYALGDVSGGHFNPAVTLAVVLSCRDKCHPVEGAVYFFTQFLAGIVAAILAFLVHMGGPPAGVPNGLKPGGGYKWFAVLLGEVLFTFLLAYVVLSVATTRPINPRTGKNFYFALAIGMCVLVGGTAIGAISGGVLNPAVAGGIAVEAQMTKSLTSVTNSGNATSTTVAPSSDATRGAVQLSRFFLYSLFELLGGVLAAAVFCCTHPAEFTDDDYETKSLEETEEVYDEEDEVE